MGSSFSSLPPSSTPSPQASDALVANAVGILPMTSRIEQLVAKDDAVALCNFLKGLERTEDQYYLAFCTACSACANAPKEPLSCLVMLSYEVTDTKTQEIYDAYLMRLYSEESRILLYLLGSGHVNPDPNVHASISALLA